MNISKKQFYAFQFLLIIYYYFKFFSFISSESIWYDDAHELLISKINLFDIEDLIGIADYHIGFSLLLLLITYVTDLQYIYFLISFLFCCSLIAVGMLIGDKLKSRSSVLISQLTLLTSPVIIQYSFRPKHFVFEFLIILVLSIYLHSTSDSKLIFLCFIPVIIFSGVSVIYLIYPAFKSLREKFDLKYLLYILIIVLFVFQRGSKKLFSERFQEYWGLDSIGLFESFERLFLNNLLFIRSFNDSGFLLITSFCLFVGIFQLFKQNRELFLFLFIPALIFNSLSFFNLYPIGKGRTDLILFPILFFSIYYFAKFCDERFKPKVVTFVFLTILLIVLPVNTESKEDNMRSLLMQTDLASFDQVYITYYSIPQFILYTDNLSKFKVDMTGEKCSYSSKTPKIKFLQTSPDDFCSPSTDLNFIKDSIKNNKKIAIIGHDSKTQNILNFVESDELLFSNLKITKVGKDELLIATLNK